MASYKIRTAGNCPAVLFTIRSPFNIRIGRGNSLPIRLLQPELFSIAAKKISIGRGPHCRYDRSRRNHSPSRQRKLESDSERRRRNERCRRNYSHCRIAAAVGLFPGNLCSDCQVYPPPPEIRNRCTKERVNGENLASIPKSGPEIKNRCTKERVNGENLASILKFGLEIKNQCTQKGINRQNPTSILKSGLEIKNRCSTRLKNRCSTRLKNRCSTMESALCRGRGMPDGQGLRTA